MHRPADRFYRCYHYFSRGSAIGTWAWDFGDGFSASVNVSSTTHSYTTPGTYPVNVIVTDINGCSGSTTMNIVVIPKPTIAFTASPTSACVPPLNVTFTNSSVSTGATTYTWTFGDGTSSTVTNPTHTYTASGTYTVTLHINQNGCIDSLIKSDFIVIQKIVADFTSSPTAICTNGTITFTNTSIPAPSTATWDFGDAGTSTAISPTHVYTTAGTYTVTLISADASGCKDTTTDTVTVNQTPVASFTADTMTACSAPFTVNFTSTSTGGTDYAWDFGDGSTSILQNPSHTYTTPGVYSVTLTVTNSSGPCVASVVKNNLIIITPPVAGFINPPDSGCVPLSINFSSTSISTIDPITNYIWNFGDGSTGTSAPPLVHTYTASGTYSPWMIIQTAHGCSDTILCVNCIKTGILPDAAFGILEDTVCYGKIVTFSDSSTNATGWLWDFGDGQFNSTQNPTHVYPDTGTYEVMLTAYNNGCLGYIHPQKSSDPSPKGNLWLRIKLHKLLHRSIYKCISWRRFSAVEFWRRVCGFFQQSKSLTYLSGKRAVYCYAHRI